ncbi:hydroxyacylglutathione hydrolase [Asticcacaulis sp. EMRT-3]|uniref:hydroxyacylglutathione hydrolase n=1 Tax=Asticcacaulis sp. EMRT-3 TaxID=3040349 RepID=UPI0024AFB2FC|nr:hydroxyacylglutathione hydrolase [Asticcacaulis sp. EMRT-3]MDI7773791.1 hydroxyacylglutathione hydrolase [Asticcacaulis sp. EMRT-3]
MPLKIDIFPCLQDNYGFLITDEATGLTAAIDAPEPAAILRQLGGRRLNFILNTHWHPDHAGGNALVQARTGCQIYGPPEVRRLAPLDHELKPGEHVMLGETRLDVLDLGGHTLGHIGYYAQGDGVAFVADTLFPLGCGRLFEGTPEQMWASLARLCALPEETVLYSAHEYTLANLKFAESLGDFPELVARAMRMRGLRARGEPTVPSSVAEEKATNPFLVYPLREDGFAAQAAKFGELRRAKDRF